MIWWNRSHARLTLQENESFTELFQWIEVTSFRAEKGKTSIEVLIHRFIRCLPLEYQQYIRLAPCEKNSKEVILRLYYQYKAEMDMKKKLINNESNTQSKPKKLLNGGKKTPSENLVKDKPIQPTVMSINLGNRIKADTQSN